MSTDGWYISPYKVPKGQNLAGEGKWCWAVFCNGVVQQGFRLTQLADALSWGPLNGKGRLPIRLRP